MTRARPVWITGLGAVSCLGNSVADLWNGVRENRTGIQNGLGAVSDSVLSAAMTDHPDAPKDWAQNRALAFSWLAVREAMAQAGWDKLNSDDGVIFATTTGQLLLWDRPFMALSQAQGSREDFRSAFHNQPLVSVQNALARELGACGPMSLLTSACSASTQALGLAAMWIEQARVRRCLVVGVEVLCDLTSEGFRSLQLLASGPSHPFDVARGGINLSEGAAAICLQADTTEPLARLSGYGFSTDGFHMTGPHPEGDGSYRAMHAALKTAQIQAEQIDWVHAHGTGSRANDQSEGLAVQRLCGGHKPWVSSTKWSHGHALAASGALESALVVRALQEGIVLHTRGLQTPDPQIPVAHPGEDRKQPLRHVLKSTLGFGGSNAALVFSQVGAPHA